MTGPTSSGAGLNLSQLDRLDAFAELFRPDFGRREQVCWAAVYLQGLLSELPRKTIGAMTPQLVLPPELEVEDVAQALQHFVNQSPWDEARVWRRFRGLVSARGPDRSGSVVYIDDLAFKKQGRHSVGVQRQYSPSHKRKINCQVAVALHHLDQEMGVPLAVRLYLPRAWLADEARLDAARVPAAHRQPQTRASLALELLAELSAEGWPIREIHAGPGFSDPDFRQALAERGWNYFLDAAANSNPLLGERSIPSLTDERMWLTNTVADAADLSPTAAHKISADLRHELFDMLGVDHFEGRSWRGFHHHACLAALAFGFRRLRFGESEG